MIKRTPPYAVKSSQQSPQDSNLRKNTSPQAPSRDGLGSSRIKAHGDEKEELIVVKFEMVLCEPNLRIKSGEVASGYHKAKNPLALGCLLGFRCLGESIAVLPKRLIKAENLLRLVMLSRDHHQIINEGRILP
jgi:hypothetical protein